MNPKANLHLIQDVLERIPDEWGKYVSCGPGWWQLISLCDKELARIDPDYEIHQVKEKFGGLRFYFHTNNPDFQIPMDMIVARYEKACAITCEETGGHGYLMKRHGLFKTLNESYLNSGWERAKQGKDE